MNSSNFSRERASQRLPKLFKLAKRSKKVRKHTGNDATRRRCGFGGSPAGWEHGADVGRGAHAPRDGENVAWVANKKLEISNFNFTFPRARHIEIIRYYRQTLQGSFSAVWKPNFASNYSCGSSRRDLITQYTTL